MAKRKLTITDHRGRQVRILTSGPVQPSKGPADAIMDAAARNRKAIGGGLIIAGTASALTMLPPNTPTEAPEVRERFSPAGITEIPALNTDMLAVDTHSYDGGVGFSDRRIQPGARLLAPPALADQSFVAPQPPPPIMRADAETGPFRAGMRTGFSNNQLLTDPMAEAMNIAFERFQHHGLSERASLTFAMQGINESLAGTALVEQGGGDGVGYFQFSRWDGNGVGAEIAALTKPGTERTWAPSDFDGADGDRAMAIRNAVDATVQLLAEDPDYAGLNTLVRDPEASFADLARATTTGFMRPSTATATRVTELTATLTRNEVAIRGNIDALTTPVRAAEPVRLSPDGGR